MSFSHSNINLNFFQKHESLYTTFSKYKLSIPISDHTEQILNVISS